MIDDTTHVQGFEHLAWGVNILFLLFLVMFLAYLPSDSHRDISSQWNPILLGAYQMSLGSTMG